MRNRPGLPSAVAPVLLGLLASSAGAAPLPTTTLTPKGATYSVQVAPVPPGYTQTFPLALNNKGAVLLAAVQGKTPDALFVWSGAALKPVTLPAAARGGEVSSSAGRHCLADDGRMVINTFNDTPPLYYDGKTFSPIAFPGTGTHGLFVGVRGCSSNLNVVASAQTGGASYLWKPGGKIIPLGQVYATAVNAAGDVVSKNGVSQGAKVTRAAEKGWTPEFINDAGLILGSDDDGAALHVWEAGAGRGLLLSPPRGSDTVFVNSLNNRGQAVVNTLDTNIFLYDHAARSYAPIRVDGWSLSYVSVINDQGWLLASGHPLNDDRTSRVLLLKPKK
ncbi:hypothetical protein [Deinococcus marmoris]|uniref:hypothetical protein n=1 Tax=Deinococcus marmoris TaxID=249408 RepID=UPI000AA58B34|nr:hypothetical protein [Deinococcus marmoris]